MDTYPDALIVNRYKLLECLGAGGMGEVWQALDTKFTRPVSVAVKFLKEDETLAADVRSRSNVDRLLHKEAAGGHLNVDLVVNLLAESFSSDAQHSGLRAAAELRFADGTVTPQLALALFDDLVNDPAVNENARHRRRLRDLFSIEANSVAMLQHPNLVRVTDYGEHESAPFLVMDFINGRTLQQVIQRREPLPLTERLAVMEDLCEGLAYAHRKQLVHRDIKPANLIIDGETGRLKILDFGVVRELQLTAARTMSLGLPIGTYCYMSPEQTRASRTLDHRSDIFAVGLVFYELLSYQRAFPSVGDVHELIGRIQRDAPKPLRDLVVDLEPEIETIVYRAIEKVPAKRFQDLADMQRQIERVRTRLEAQQRRQAQAGAQTLAQRPQSLAVQCADLVDRALAASDAGDDETVIALCDELLALAPAHPEALDLQGLARVRLASRALEATLADARHELERGALTAAGLVLERPDVDPRNPLVRTFIEELDRARRARRVESLIQDARMLLTTSEPDAAIERAQAALELDPASTDAQRIVERATVQRSRQRQQEIDAVLAEAEAAVVAGRLADAIRTLTPLAGATKVDAMLAALLPKRDEQLARERTVADAVARSRGLIESGEFARALEVVLQAGSVDRKHVELSDLRRWLEPVVGALRRLDDGIARFDQDAAIEAEDVVRDAIHALTPYLDEHPALRTRVEEVAVARSAAIERRLADERRQDALAKEQARRALRTEQEERDRAVAEAAQRVMAALTLDRIEAAERELAQLTALPGSEATVVGLTRELAPARQRAADAAATRQCELARQLATGGDLEGALAQLRAAAAHPIIDVEIASIELTLRKRGEDRARTFESQRVKRDVEQRADEAIAAADARFAAGERREALALLTDFRPRHPRVDERLEALSKEIAQLDAAEQADAARRAARVELERLEVERQELLRSADEARGRKEFAEAFALLDKLDARSPGYVGAVELRARTLTDLKTAASADPANAALRDLLQRRGPTRSPLTIRLLAATAAVVVLTGALALFLMNQQITPTGPPNGPELESPSDDVKLQPPPTNSGPDKPAEPTGTTAGLPPTPPPTPQTAMLTVDFRPWARVRIRATAGGANVPEEPQITPFVVSLPPGEYTLRGENDGLSQPVEVRVRLTAGQARVVSQVMPGFDADRVIEALLSKDR